MTNGTELKIKYKLTNSFVCDEGVCLKTSFILVKNLNQPIILGTPFLSLIKPFQVDDQGMQAKLLGRELVFRFIQHPYNKTLQFLKSQTINQISRKQKQIEYLKEEVSYKRIEEELKNSK